MHRPAPAQAGAGHLQRAQRQCHQEAAEVMTEASAQEPPHARGSATSGSPVAGSVLPGAAAILQNA